MLRPGGKLIISSPDSEIYSSAGSCVNPFHVKELTRLEFGELLRARFVHCDLYAQRTMTGTMLLADIASQTKSSNWTFERRGDRHFEATRGLPRAPFVLAVASNEPIGVGFDSFYIETSDLDAPARAVADLTAEHLRQITTLQSEQREQRSRAAEKLAELQANCADERHRMDTAHSQERRQTEAACTVQIENAERQIRALQRELNTALKEAESAKAFASCIEGSTTWRWSAPLRQLINALHR